MDSNNFLSECWRLTRTAPAKRARSMCDLALGIGSSSVMPLGSLEDPGMPQWSLPVPAIPPRAPVSAAVTPAPVPAVQFVTPQLKTRSSRLPPAAADALDRSRALGAWADIIAKCGAAFAMNSQLVGDTWSEEDLEPYFATKRSGTLAIHASAWRLFLRFVDAEGLDAEAVDECMAYAYLVHLEKQAAPASRASAFLRSCNFAFGTCAFLRGPSVAQSARCLGKASRSLATKRPRLQRDILKVEWVKALELEVVLCASGSGALTLQEGEVAGFALFCTHGRSRCSDAAKVVVEPELDDDPEGDAVSSFLEAVTTGAKVKTGNTPAKAGLVLPIVALSRGISDLQWGEAWLKIRSSLGHCASADGCLQLEPLADGTFGAGRIQAGQTTEWLRHLLCKLNVLPHLLTNVGSHSCKATLLSIAAKAGLPRDVRRVLGGHALPGDASVDVYSRDALAAPLRELALTIRAVRRGDFDPDASRSGRWRKLPASCSSLGDERCQSCAVPLSVGRVFKCKCGLWSHLSTNCSSSCLVCELDICKTCTAASSHKCAKGAYHSSDSEDDDAESELEDDSDGEHALMAADDAEAAFEADEAFRHQAEFGVHDGSSAAFPEGGILTHKVTGKAHKLKSPMCCACGIKASQLSYDFQYEESSLLGRPLCMRKGCAPWKHVDVAYDILCDADGWAFDA